jgi:hypothetical protein
VAARRLERALLALPLPNRSIVVPAFQLTDAGEPRPELHPLLEQLLLARINGWAVWTWLTHPSSLLSGDVPERVAVTDPERGAASGGPLRRGSRWVTCAVLSGRPARTAVARVAGRS